jgi:SAM-dependent methyltransferase
MSNPLDAFFHTGSLEVDRLSLYHLLERHARQSGWRIVDVGGGTSTSLIFADTVVDRVRKGQEWFVSNRPAVRYIEHDLLNPLPLRDGEFTLAFSSHCIEHVRDPAQLCRELSRVAQYVALCYPQGLSDDLISGSQARYPILGHKWWLTFNSTPPASVDYMHRQELLQKMPNFERRHYIEHDLVGGVASRTLRANSLRQRCHPLSFYCVKAPSHHLPCAQFMTFYRGSWEQCILARSPLRCNLVPPNFTPLFVRKPRNATGVPWEGWRAAGPLPPAGLTALRKAKWTLGQLMKMPAELRGG